MSTPLQAATKEAEELKAKLAEKAKKLLDKTMSEVAKEQATKKATLKVRRTLKGHLAKIYAMHWCGGEAAKRQLVSASQVRNKLASGLSPSVFLTL